MATNHQLIQSHSGLIPSCIRPARWGVKSPIRLDIILRLPTLGMAVPTRFAQRVRVMQFRCRAQSPPQRKLAYVVV